MPVDLLQLSLSFQMPAMNPFTLSSYLSSIIMLKSDKGEYREFFLLAGEAWWDWLTEGVKYVSGSPVSWQNFDEVWVYDGEGVHSDFCASEGIFHNSGKLSSTR